VTFSVPATGVVGQPLSVSATFSSSVPRAGGNVTFFLFPTSDTTCTGNVALVNQSEHVDGDGVHTSPTYTPTTPGTYGWVIIYGDDANHEPKYTICQPTVVGSPPTVTSGTATTFTAGTSETFSVTTTAGSPEPTTLSASGALPNGITFTDNGDGTATLAGTPGALTGGSYPLTITAANSLASTTQSFVLTVGQSPLITSSNATTFSTGGVSSFTIATTPGFPTSTTLSESGALPSGISFTDNHDGTATLFGIPDATAGGRYPLTITGSNGTAPNAAQSFTLTVTQPVAIPGTAQAVFQVGQNGSHYVVATAGYPATGSLILAGDLPAGLSFTDFGDGTGSFSGTPDAGSGGQYPVTITASNGVGTPAVQDLDITVNEPPAITSPDTWTSTIGVTSSFTVTTSPGYPSPYTLSDSGTMPAGLTLALSGDSATISGIPTGPAGNYPITLTATNGIDPDTVQILTVTVAAASPVPLPSVAPPGSGALVGVPTTSHPRESFSATASGFAPGAPITWAIYSTARTLTTSVADANGDATARLTIPAGLSGLHTIVAAGIAPDGSPLFVTATTTVIAPTSTTALSSTGVSVGTLPLAALLLLLVGLGLMLAVRLRRVRRHSAAESA
jgi:hypothetical protein